jgi:hypothetical protein
MCGADADNHRISTARDFAKAQRVHSKSRLRETRKASRAIAAIPARRSRGSTTRCGRCSRCGRRTRTRRVSPSPITPHRLASGSMRRRFSCCLPLCLGGRNSGPSPTRHVFTAGDFPSATIPRRQRRSGPGSRSSAQLLLAGVHPKAAQQWLGHSTVITTLDLTATRWRRCRKRLPTVSTLRSAVL